MVKEAKYAGEFATFPPQATWFARERGSHNTRNGALTPVSVGGTFTGLCCDAVSRWMTVEKGKTDFGLCLEMMISNLLVV